MKQQFELFITDEQKMEALGRVIGAALNRGDILYLSGVLGAGKTTLTRGVLQGLDYDGCVTSPSFVLMNIYPAKFPVYHFDFYRLESTELFELGLDDYLGKESICIIEWPEIGAEILPKEALWINIRLKDDDYGLGRFVSFYAVSKSAGLLLERLKEHVDISY